MMQNIEGYSVLSSLTNLLATENTPFVMQDIHRGSYMSAHVLLFLLKELGKRDKIRDLPSNLSLFATCLINSIIQEHEC